MNIGAAIMIGWACLAIGFVLGALWCGMFVRQPRYEDECEEFEVQQPATGGASAGERQL